MTNFAADFEARCVRDVQIDTESDDSSSMDANT